MAGGRLPVLMDSLAITWLFRAAAFAVAAGIWVAYMQTKPRHWMASLGLFTSVYLMIVTIWQVIERPNASASPVFSDPLKWAVGASWGIMAALIAVSGLHAIAVRKVRNGTSARLRAVVNGEDHAA